MADFDTQRALQKNRIRRRGIYLLPNLFTTAALFAGFYAIVQAMNLRFDQAALAIFVAIGALTGQFGRSHRKIAARAVTLQRHTEMTGKHEVVGAVLLKEDSLAGNKRVARFLESRGEARSTAADVRESNRGRRLQAGMELADGLEQAILAAGRDA